MAAPEVSTLPRQDDVTRYPADSLPPTLQEEVYFLIREARAVAFLMEYDNPADPDTMKHAAAAMSRSLGAAMRIMETGKDSRWSEMQAPRVADSANR